MPGLQPLTTRGKPETVLAWNPKLLPGLLLFLLLSFAGASQGEDRVDNEYRIKAAFLYNFSSFISWPEMARQDQAEFRVCILGDDPFGSALDSLSGKTVRGMPLQVRRLAAGADSQSCQLVYISKSETGRLSRILEEVAGKPVLTVSDIDNFALSGGMIRFKLLDNKIRFDINVDSAERAGLKISSRLLSLATIITGERVTAR